MEPVNGCTTSQKCSWIFRPILSAPPAAAYHQGERALKQSARPISSRLRRYPGRSSQTSRQRAWYPRSSPQATEPERRKLLGAPHSLAAESELVSRVREGKCHSRGLDPTSPPELNATLICSCCSTLSVGNEINNIRAGLQIPGRTGGQADADLRRIGTRLTLGEARGHVTRQEHGTHLNANTSSRPSAVPRRDSTL